MIIYEYTARNASTGQKIKAEVEAENIQSAASLIKNQGLSPLDIKPKAATSSGFKKYFNRIKTND